MGTLKGSTGHFLISVPKVMGGLGSRFVVMCRQSHWPRPGQTHYIFPVKNLEIVAWIVLVKLNYDSIVDKRGSKAPSLLKRHLQEISEPALRPHICFS